MGESWKPFGRLDSRCRCHRASWPKTAVQSQSLRVGSRVWASIGRCCFTTVLFHDAADVRAAEAIRPTLRAFLRIDVRVAAFHGFDVGVAAFLRIDVRVAVLATRTQITGNPATPTSISRKARSRPDMLRKRVRIIGMNAGSESAGCLSCPLRPAALTAFPMISWPWAPRALVLRSDLRFVRAPRSDLRFVRRVLVGFAFRER